MELRETANANQDKLGTYLLIEKSQNGMSLTAKGTEEELTKMVATAYLQEPSFRRLINLAVTTASLITTKTLQSNDKD